jgi:hypothetical protein
MAATIKNFGFCNAADESPAKADKRHSLKAALEQLSPIQKRELAKQLGYESFESLLAASHVIVLADGSDWCLTRDICGGWMAWNVCTIDLRRRNRSDEEPCAGFAVRGGEAVI